MADKDPRRRKKRKDVRKVHFTEDARPDEFSFISPKPDPKESDQEIEEEIIVLTHEPSQFAKLVFMVLFSALVLSMSFVFISLHGADRGPSDFSNDDHAEDHAISDSAQEQINLEGINKLEDIADVLTESDQSSLLNDEQIRIESEITKDFNILDAHLIDNPTESISTADYDIITESDEVFENSPKEMKDIEPHIDINDDADNQISSTPYVELKTESYEVEDDHVEFKNDYQDNITADFEILEEPSISDSIVYLPEEETELKTDVVLSEYERELEQDELISSDQEDFVLKEELPNTDDDLIEDDDYHSYENYDITNSDDYEIKEKLDEVDDALEKSPEKALKMCEDLLHSYNKSPRLHYMKAQALDQLAELHRSNKYLEEAIASYQKVVTLLHVPEKLYLLAGRRAADRLRFRGFLGKSLKLLAEISQRYPYNIEIKQELAVGYLLIGQNKESKKIFLEVLDLSPNNGFAKVHLGFILKTDESNYTAAIDLMSEGISSKEQGVIDGRFYFHLGDALQRVGKQAEALKVYEEGVKEGFFFSIYQRSLYNVKGLTGKPWWEPHDTPYSSFLKILEDNWILIRDEALSLIQKKTSNFVSESEGLQDKGDWKQFEIFARGKKIENNCVKVPKTCALILKMPDAAGCKRGQVKFSIMHPNTHVWAHTGPTNCRLRAHLGLVIPDGASLRVATETRHWQEGKILLFDDSFEHEVWHNGSTFRLVLIVDFWHPELTAYQKKTLSPI